jgi:hypothetical protein
MWYSANEHHADYPLLAYKLAPLALQRGISPLVPGSLIPLPLRHRRQIGSAKRWDHLALTVKHERKNLRYHWRDQRNWA